MKKLDTPFGMLFTVAMLAIYAAGAFMVAAMENSPTIAAAGVLAAVAAVGTALVKPWSRYVVYALAPAFVAKFAHSVRSGADAGYFSARFDSSAHAALSLVPGVLLTMLLLACCFIVHRHFASGSLRTDPDAA